MEKMTITFKDGKGRTAPVTVPQSQIKALLNLEMSEATFKYDNGVFVLRTRSTLDLSKISKIFHQQKPVKSQAPKQAMNQRRPQAMQKLDNAWNGLNFLRTPNRSAANSNK